VGGVPKLNIAQCVVSARNRLYSTPHKIKLPSETVQGKRVRKPRYYYEEGGVMYEIALFQDALLGLVDVEFVSHEEKSNNKQRHPTS
jgi:CYTH domain-containing protein